MTGISAGTVSLGTRLPMPIIEPLSPEICVVAYYKRLSQLISLQHFNSQLI